MEFKIPHTARYFKQASYMLGPREAERHLQIAFDSLIGEDRVELTVMLNNPDLGDLYTLDSLFYWQDTPQGFCFWSLVSRVATREETALHSDAGVSGVFDGTEW